MTLPLTGAISDAKVLTGRQRPMTEVAFLFAEIRTEAGHEGVGFSYSKRAGGPAQFAHAGEVAPDLIGEDPNDIGRLWTKLVWAGASVGRSGASTQAIAAIDVALWDLKAKRAGLPLAKLLGAHRDSVRCYDTSGGFLHEPIEQVLDNATAHARARHRRHQDQGRPPVARPSTCARVRAVREHLGDDVPLMVDANQQWDRPTAQRVGRALEEFGLVWIEEPLDAYDAEGHAALARSLDTAIATGEMLTSVAEHDELIRHGAVDVIQPDAPRIGGITQFLRLAALAEHRNLAAGAALRDGDPRPPRRRLPARALGRALRLAAPAVQRTPGDPRRPHAPLRPARPRRHPQRAGPRLDRRPRTVDTPRDPRPEDR